MPSLELKNLAIPGISGFPFFLEGFQGMGILKNREYINRNTVRGKIAALQ